MIFCNASFLPLYSLHFYVHHFMLTFLPGSFCFWKRHYTVATCHVASAFNLFSLTYLLPYFHLYYHIHWVKHYTPPYGTHQYHIHARSFAHCSFLFSFQHLSDSIFTYFPPIARSPEDITPPSLMINATLCYSFRALPVSSYLSFEIARWHLFYLVFTRFLSVIVGSA